MTKIISLKETRDRFSDLLGKADRLSGDLSSREWSTKAVVMSVEEFDSWVETLEFMSNPKAVKALEQGLKEAKAKKFRSFKEAFGESQ